MAIMWKSTNNIESLLIDFRSRNQLSRMLECTTDDCQSGLSHRPCLKLAELGTVNRKGYANSAPN